MNMIRLGDRLSGYSKSESRSTRFINDEYMAQTVFDPVPDKEEIPAWFLQSQPLDESNAFRDLLPEDLPQLGSYEVKIIDKLIHPKRPVLAIVGPMGSGKTTMKNYIALHLVKNRRHCERCDRRSNRLIAHINFDEHTYLNDLSGVTLTNKFFNILCDELRSRIVNDASISEEEELFGFWDYELERFIHQKSSSLAFRKVAAKIRFQPRTPDQPIPPEALEVRRKMKSQIEKSPETHLDYLIRLWGYIIKFQFCNNSGCAYIILDNVDHAEPILQKKIVELIHSHVQMNGPTFIILVRPETFDNLGLGTGIIDAEMHHGPRVLDVIKKRLELFCSNPDAFYEPGRGLSDSQYQVLKSFLVTVNREIQVDKYQNFQNFIDNACGSSIRNGMLLMQGLFAASVADMMDTNLTSRDLIRILIRHGQDQFHWSASHQINHMFRVENHNGNSLLVKPRILRYLGRHEKGKRRINEIVNVLQAFGYDDDLTISALNDLMRITSQLVRSNGFNYYEDDSLRKYGGHNIFLTDIGRGYSNYLCSNIDYLQEVMLDTFVDGDNFPQQIGYGYVVEKFKLLYLFLKELRRIDVEETERFTETWTPKAYIDSFGDHLVTLDMIQSIHQPVTGILSSERHDRYEADELIRYFTSLVLQVEEDNRRILGVQINSIIPQQVK